MKSKIRIFAGLAVLLFAWYLVADRVTPYTANARVKAIVIPVVPEVSGYVSALAVNNGQFVNTGDLLARVDQRQYALAVDQARAALQTATQAVGAGSAGVEVARANLTQAQVNLENTKVQSARVFELEQKNVVAKAQADDARAQLKEAQSKVTGAEADLERARKQLGDAGANNPQIQAAVAQLGQAELALKWTELRAPAHGTVVDLTIAEGTFAQAGKPLMTFGSLDDVWIEAYFTENNLGRIKVGQPADITLDIYPGRIFKGVVSSITPGASVGPESSGGLPRAQDEKAWMRDAQRFPVRIHMLNYEVGSENADIRRFFNGQADVIVYTSNNWLLNALGAFWIRLNAWVSYAY